MGGGFAVQPRSQRTMTCRVNGRLVCYKLQESNGVEQLYCGGCGRRSFACRCGSAGAITLATKGESVSRTDRETGAAPAGAAA